jgi:hypothetical protein
MAQHESKSPSARALKRIIDDDENTFDVKELAEVGECSKRHLYNVIDLTSDTEMRTPIRDRISRYLSDHGEFRLSYAGLAEDLRIVRARFGQADGDIQDDVMDLIKAATGIDDAVDDLNVKEARRCISDIRHELTELKAELAALETRQ